MGNAIVSQTVGNTTDYYESPAYTVVEEKAIILSIIHSIMHLLIHSFISSMRMKFVQSSQLTLRP